MVSLSNHVAIPLQQRRRFQRRDCQPQHRVRGRNDKFCDFLSLYISFTLPAYSVCNTPATRTNRRNAGGHHAQQDSDYSQAMVYRLSHRRIAGSRFDGRCRLCGQLTHPGPRRPRWTCRRAGRRRRESRRNLRPLHPTRRRNSRIESETVGSAFATAQHELADEQFATKMDTLVEDGTLTREQADAANAWFTARPADAGRIAYIAVGAADSDKVAQILQKGG